MPSRTCPLTLAFTCLIPTPTPTPTPCAAQDDAAGARGGRERARAAPREPPPGAHAERAAGGGGRLRPHPGHAHPAVLHAVRACACMGSCRRAPGCGMGCALGMVGIGRVEYGIPWEVLGAHLPNLPSNKACWHLSHIRFPLCTLLAAATPRAPWCCGCPPCPLRCGLSQVWARPYAAPWWSSQPSLPGL